MEGGVFSLGPGLHLLPRGLSILILVSSQPSHYSHNLSYLPAHDPLKGHTTHLICLNILPEITLQILDSQPGFVTISHQPLLFMSGLWLYFFSQELNSSLLGCRPPATPMIFSHLDLSYPGYIFSSNDFLSVSSNLQWDQILPGRTRLICPIFTPRDLWVAQLCRILK